MISSFCIYFLYGSFDRELSRPYKFRECQDTDQKICQIYASWLRVAESR